MTSKYMTGGFTKDLSTGETHSRKLFLWSAFLAEKKMFTHRKYISIFLFLLLLMTMPAFNALAEKDYFAERYDVDISVQPDGALLVTETILFQFQGGPFTQVFRELAGNQLDEIDSIQAYLDGRPLPQGPGPGQVEIEAGEPLKVTWHFEPVSDSAHIYKLTYQVLGAIRDGEAADTLIWSAIPPEHDYRIESSRITLAYPANANLVAEPSLTGVPASLEGAQGRYVFSSGEIASDTGVQLEAAFDPGFITQPPDWQARQIDRQDRLSSSLPLGLATAGLALALGIGALLLFASRHRRDSSALPGPTLRPTTPPGPVPPALAARLTGSQNASLAALFELARRGRLRFDKLEVSRKSKEYSLAQQENGVSLKPHESALLEALFLTKEGVRERLPLSEIGTKLAHGSGKFNTALDNELTGLGWIEPPRMEAKNRLLAISLLAIFFGIGLFLAGFLLPFPVLAGIFLGLGAALFLLGIAAVIYGATFSSWSVEGERQAAAWRGFASYLKDITRGREPVQRPDAFDLYLPYAAGFGLADAWAKYFQRQADVPIPAWFGGLNAGMSDFSDITAVIIASTVAASGDGGAGAAGASGGGASGAS
jgi:uncharacterized protein (TIGR04222 family)